MKHWTIRKLLATSIAGICVLAVLAQAIFAQLSFRYAFASYIENVHRPQLESIASNLAEYYDSERGWNRVQRNLDIWIRVTSEPQRRQGRINPDTLPRNEDGETVVELAPEGFVIQPPITESRGYAFSYTEGSNLALFDANNEYVFGNANMLQEDRKISVEILADGVVIGYLLSPGGMRIADTIDDAFSDQLRGQYLLAGLCIALLSILAALPVAKQFSRPVTRLDEGTDRLMQGDYDTKIDINGPLEFGLLERKFNRLALTLDSHRTSQQHWIANISHELRTPLAVLRAELDALDAGIRTFGDKELSSLIEETQRLNRLVDDLFFLSRSDTGDFSYQFMSLDLNSLISDLTEEFQELARESGLTLTANLAEKAIFIDGDEGRLCQLFGNLLTNSCAYTESGGTIQVSVSEQEDRVVVEVDDTMPGVPQGDLGKIFDRLYRVDKSRARSDGGSGLGLSICKVIAKAHDAEIIALHSELGGLKTTVSFVNSAKS